jgi:hypothetical protein
MAFLGDYVPDNNYSYELNGLDGLSLKKITKSVQKVSKKVVQATVPKPLQKVVNKVGKKIDDLKKPIAVGVSLVPGPWQVVGGAAVAAITAAEQIKAQKKAKEQMAAQKKAQAEADKQANQIIQAMTNSIQTTTPFSAPSASLLPMPVQSAQTTTPFSAPSASLLPMPVQSANPTNSSSSAYYIPQTSSLPMTVPSINPLTAAVSPGGSTPTSTTTEVTTSIWKNPVILITVGILGIYLLRRK